MVTGVSFTILVYTWSRLMRAWLHPQKMMYRIARQVVFTQQKNIKTIKGMQNDKARAPEWLKKLLSFDYKEQ